MRAEVLKEIACRPWVRGVLGFWVIVGGYDLIRSEFLPPDIAAKLPNLYEMVSAVIGWSDWQIWAAVLALILCAACIEAVVRERRRANMSKEKETPPQKPAVIDIQEAPGSGGGLRMLYSTVISAGGGGTGIRATNAKLDAQGNAILGGDTGIEVEGGEAKVHGNLIAPSTKPPEPKK